MEHEKNHDYHIVNPSKWPFFGALSGFTLLIGAVLWMKGITPFVFIIAVTAVLYVMFAWWSDMVAESAAGDYTPVTKISLRYGFILFITSEVMFFSAWFWSFFEHAIYPMGGVWPPAGIDAFDPWHLPLINTLVLLCSGMAATWAHHAISHENNREDLKHGLVIAILLGIAFTVLQGYEYGHAAFSFSGNIYGANFFMATGFHGAHVIIGSLFLIVCLVRAYSGHFTPEGHSGFEAAAWYWHFVDVVWLFLFAAVYVWGS